MGDAYHQFTHDNKTEFPNEVNILERFNIYQEIVLGIIYRIFQPAQRPILWYAYSGSDFLKIPKRVGPIKWSRERKALERKARYRNWVLLCLFKIRYECLTFKCYILCHYTLQRGF